jgi:hypothetical protein
MRAEKSAFVSSRVKPVTCALRCVWVDLAVGAPADLLKIGDVGLRHGLMLGIGKCRHPASVHQKHRPRTGHFLGQATTASTRAREWRGTASGLAKTSMGKLGRYRDSRLAVRRRCNGRCRALVASRHVHRFVPRGLLRRPPSHQALTVLGLKS